jgi:predicted SprT family Zn-dependent metalloprotease
MDDNTTTTLAMQLMSDNGLRDWTFSIDTAKTRAGICDYDARKISISRNYIYNPHTTVEHIRDAILHEIAHALTPQDQTHGEEWKQQALRIGCSGDRYCPHPVSLHKAYSVTCACGKINTQRHRIHHRLRHAVCKYCLEKLCIVRELHDEHMRHAPLPSSSAATLTPDPSGATVTCTALLAGLVRR